MYPQLLHIYGPFFIQSYGFCIAAGLLLFAWLLYQDKQRRMLVDDDLFHTFLLTGTLAGILGGRALFFITNERAGSIVEFFQFWQGGFAVLGSLLSVLAVTSVLLWWHRIPVLPTLDRVALYTPLLHSVSRIGCFLSGCCYGRPSSIAWAVTYINKDCRTPLLGISVHPAQLYSALFLISIFAFLLFVDRVCMKKGQLLALYLFLAGCERFIIDYFRDDSTYSFMPNGCISDHQLIALCIAVAAVFIFFICSQSKGTVTRAVYQ